MDREMFDEAIGAVPPSTVDVEGAIARGRRAARIRLVANPWVATAAAVVAIAFAAVAVLLPGNQAGSVGAAPPHRTTTAKPPATSSSPPVTCDGRTEPRQVPPEEAAAVSTRLSSALTAAVQAKLPAGSQLTANPAGDYPKGHPHGPLEFYYVGQPLKPVEHGCQGGVSYYTAWATVVRSGSPKGNLMALISAVDSFMDPLECSTGTVVDARYSCTKQTGPHGETILTSVLTQDGGGPTNYRVDVVRTDGIAVLLDSANVGGDAKNGGRPASQTPPLSHQQLIDIALGAALTLSP